MKNIKRVSTGMFLVLLLQGSRIACHYQRYSPKPSSRSFVSLLACFVRRKLISARHPGFDVRRRH
jgi:hypothetical protein